MSTATVLELAPRHLAVLRAVAAGRAELTCSRAPDVYVDGLCCTDHSVATVLTTAGLITTGSTHPAEARVPARLTAAGRVVLITNPLTPRPGGMSLASLRRVGSPSTHDRSERNPMLRTTNADCLALGCDWDWGVEPCSCGRPHTFRICARCLVADDPVCDADEDDGAGVAA